MMSIETINSLWRTGRLIEFPLLETFPSQFSTESSVYAQIQQIPDETTALSTFLDWIRYIKSLVLTWEKMPESKLLEKSNHMDFSSMDISNKDRSLLELKAKFLKNENVEEISTDDLAIFPMQRLRSVKLFKIS